MAIRSKRATFLTQLTLKNVKSFDGEHILDLVDSNGHPARWTLILGDNGVGKTTLLACLAHLAPVFNSPDESGAEDPQLFVEPRVARAENAIIYPLGRIGDVECELRATYAIESILDRGGSDETIDTWLRFSTKAGRSDDIEPSQWPKEIGVVESKWKDFSKYREPLVLAYGAGRHMGDGNLDFDAAPEATDSLLQDSAELFDVAELLQHFDYAAVQPRAVKAKRQKQVLLETMAALLPEVKSPEDIRIYPPTAIGAQGRSGVYVRTMDGEVPLRQVSLGYQTMLAWVADVGWRLFAHYPDAKNPLHEPAIVLIDEIDLHLHPKWQRQIRRLLTSHFPNVQFIATAHSPLMAQAFLDANLAVVLRENDHSIIDNDPAVVANWRIDQIVTSELIGLSTPWPAEVDALFKEQSRLLAKSQRSGEENARLKVIEAQMLELPTERDPQNEEAMKIIREAAVLLKHKVRPK